jgi:hypothetical protein
MSHKIKIKAGAIASEYATCFRRRVALEKVTSVPLLYKCWNAFQVCFLLFPLGLSSQAHAATAQLRLVATMGMS